MLSGDSVERWLPRAAHAALQRHGAAGLAVCVLRTAGRADEAHAHAQARGADGSSSGSGSGNGSRAGMEMPRSQRGVGSGGAATAAASATARDPSANFSVCRAFGFSDAEAGTLASSRETVFDVGAHSRLLTVLAALQLWQAGMLPLDEGINASLPPCLQLPHDERLDAGGPVTLRHLLTHTSGFAPASMNPSEDGEGGLLGSRPSSSSGSAGPPPTALVAYLSQCNGRRYHAPGERFVDSDFNYLLAGAAIERVTGTTFANVVAQSVFAPLRMGAALNCMGRAHVDALAKSYESAGGGWSGGVWGPGGWAGGGLSRASSYGNGFGVDGEGADGGAEGDVDDGHGDSGGGGGGSAACNRFDGDFVRPNGTPLAQSLDSFSPVVGLLLTADEMGVLGGALLESDVSCRGRRRTLLRDAAIDELRALVVPASNPPGYREALCLGLRATYSSGQPLSTSRELAAEGDGEAAIEAGPLLLHLRGSRRTGADAVLAIAPAQGVLFWVATNTTAESASEYASSQGEMAPATAATELAEDFVSRFLTPPPHDCWRQWFQELPPAPADPLVHCFCFPYAGGSAPVMFEAWSSLLPDFISPTAVLLPGRGSRVKEPPQDSIRALATEIASAMAPSLHEGGARARAIFFGHGFGALLAYETARALKAKYDWSPMLLVVSGSNGPTARCINAPNVDMASDTSPSGSAGSRMTSPTRQLPLHLLPDNELAEALCSAARVPRHFRRNALMLRAMIGTVRADVAAEETYQHEAQAPPVQMRGEMQFVAQPHRPIAEPRAARLSKESDESEEATSGHLSIGSLSPTQMMIATPAPPLPAVKLSCDILAYAGTQDFDVDDRINAWQDVTTGTSSLHRLPGDHYYIDDLRSREILLRALAKAIAGHMSPTHAPSFFTTPSRNYF